MKSTGMTRPIDNLGRVVIPMEIRTRLGIEPKDVLEISMEGNTIVLKKTCDSCIFCGKEDQLIIFKDKKLCKPCLERLTKELK